jgi:hypothetical protein
MLLSAAEPPVAVVVGATKEAVLGAYGPPVLQSRLGPREILKYPQGQVILEEGRVVRLEFKGGQATTPVAAPAKKSSPVAPAVSAPGGWLSDFELASREAVRRSAPMLAWFSGSDWSLASRQFRDEVALQGDFVAAFQARYVLLRVELTDHNSSIRDPNTLLRERLGVTVYPTLLILSTAGENLAKLDLARPAAAEAYSARVIASVREMHDLLGFAPLPAETASVASTPATTAHRPVRAVTPGQVTTSLLSAGNGILSAIGSGLVFAVVLLWLLWRRSSRPGPERRSAGMAERISEAASGVPTLPEIMAWPKERVAVIAAGLAESEGYLTEIDGEGAGGGSDIRLRKLGEPGVQGLVCCAGAKVGVVTAKRVRELQGQMAAEGATFGWFVAPMGFSAEARRFADEHRIRLSDGHRLLAQLHELPPVVLPKVVTRTPWMTV